MERVITTSVRVPEHVWRLLRALAEQRALKLGGRASASAVVVDLVQKAAEEAERRAR